jgi:hypothetical protein
MPAALIAALKKSYAAQKAKGRLKGVDEGRYVYGTKAVQDYMKREREGKSK